MAPSTFMFWHYCTFCLYDFEPIARSAFSLKKGLHRPPISICGLLHLLPLTQARKKPGFRPANR